MAKARTGILHCIKHRGTHARVEAGQILLNCGADIDAQNVFNRTALAYAAMDDYVEFARMLLECGPVIDARDNVDRTPLHFAAQNGRNEVVRLQYRVLGYNSIVQEVHVAYRTACASQLQVQRACSVPFPGVLG
jgi:ankyrin repeat protein